MSTNSFPFPNYKYKSNTLRNHSYNPKIVNSYDTSTMKVGHYTKKKPTLISINGMPSYAQTSNYFILTPDKYIYQDECPDSNVIFFNSNLQKYRIDSLGRKQIIDSTSSKSTEKYYSSSTFNKYYNKNRQNKTLNYSLNLNQPNNEYKRNLNILSNKNGVNIKQNMISHGRMNQSEILSKSQNKSSYSYGKNDRKEDIYSSHNRQNKSFYSYGSNNLNKEKKTSIYQNQKISLYNKPYQNKYQCQFQNENKKDNNDSRRLIYSTFNKNDRNIIKDISNKVEVNKNENRFSKAKDNLVDHNRGGKSYQSQENKDNEDINYNLRDAKTTLLNAKENANLRGVNKAKENINLNNENKDEYLYSIDINNKENKLSNSKEKQQLKENRFSRKQYQNQINQSNLNNFQNNQNNIQQLNESKLKNSNYKDNINQNINQDNQNVKIFNKTEEKTIVVLPGQTIEPKTINETFEKPIVETIENEDGTTSSIIKQTKITIISENVPIGNEKIKSIEGAPDLPIVKQYITYEYKTVSSPKEGKIMANQILKSQNKVFEEDKLYSEKYQDQNVENKNLNEDLRYNNNQMENEGIHRNYFAYDEENLKEEINQHNLHENESEENKPENLKNEKIGQIKGNQGDIRGNEGLNMRKGNFANNKDIQKNEEKNGNKENNNEETKFAEKNGNKKNNLNYEKYGDDNKRIEEDNYLQTSLKEKELGENSGKKRLGLSKNKNEDLPKQRCQEGSGNKIIGLSEKRGNTKSEGKNINDLKYGKNQKEIKEFSSSLKKEKKKEEMKNIEKSDKKKEGTKISEKYGKNIEEMKNLEKTDKNKKGMKISEKSGKNRKGIKSLEKSSKNKDIMKISEKPGKKRELIKSLEKSSKNKDIMKISKELGKNVENKDLDKNSLDNKRNKLDKAIAAVDNTVKESIKKLSEFPQTKEEKLIIDIIKKGENATPEEKQKRFKFLLELYRKCSQKGNKEDKEKNIEKLGLFLSSLGELEKKDILPKLKNFCPDNEELYNKLIGIISKKYSLKPKGKKEDRHETNSLNKNILNMDLEKKNIKKKGEIKGYNDFSQSLHLDFKFRDNPEKAVFSHENINPPLLKGDFSETIEIKNVNPLKFDGLFLEISKYESVQREKNPFEGPSPFDKFYKIRKTKIRKKIITMANEEINDEKINEKK